jgi:hypothetical protein
VTEQNAETKPADSISYSEEIQMKTIRKNWDRLAVLVGVGLCLMTLFVCHLAWATPPGVKIVVSGTNQITVVVTNSVPTATYEIFWQEFLDGSSLSNGTWQLIDIGSVGQTNFPFDTGETMTGFFRAVNRTDFDMDGVPNFEDARPFDPTIGILTVTIETPANGANVQ